MRLQLSMFVIGLKGDEKLIDETAFRRFRDTPDLLVKALICVPGKRAGGRNARFAGCV